MASKFVVKRKSATCLTTKESRRVYRDALHYIEIFNVA